MKYFSINLLDLPELKKKRGERSTADDAPWWIRWFS